MNKIKEYKQLIWSKKIMASIVAVGALVSVGAILGLNGYFGGGEKGVPEDTMTRGLVAYYSFDEGSGQTAYNATDTGSVNDGTLGSSAGVDTNDPKYLSVINDQSSMGPSGSALSFDGSNDYVDCGSDASLNITDAITIEAWVKADELPFSGHQGIVSKGDAEQRCPWVWGGDGQNCARMQFETTTGGADDGSVTTADLVEGEWHHIAFTWDGTTVIPYLNGIAGTSDTTTGHTMVTSADALLIGYIPTYAYFNGTIDEVRIYNRALSAEEVRYHYNRGGPVAHWRFDEGEGQVVYDSTDNNNDGTLGATSATSTDDPSWVAGKHNSALEFDGVDDYVSIPDDDSLDITDAITIGLWINDPPPESLAQTEEPEEEQEQELIPPIISNTSNQFTSFKTLSGEQIEVKNGKFVFSQGYLESIDKKVFLENFKSNQMMLFLLTFLFYLIIICLATQFQFSRERVSINPIRSLPKFSYLFKINYQKIIPVFLNIVIILGTIAPVFLSNPQTVQATQFLDTPVDKSLSATEIWTDIDLSSDIPAHATGAIFQVQSGGLGYNYGFRKKGSTDNRHLDASSLSNIFVMIGVDSNRKCQGYIENTNVDFKLVGYAEGDASFFTNAYNKSLGTTDTWQDIDLSSQLPSGAVAAIFEVEDNYFGNRSYGLRNNSSTDNRYYDLCGSSHTWFIVGVDANRKCEGKIESTDVDFFLIGYLSLGQAETNGTNRSLGSTGSYIDIDESSTAPSNASGVFGEVFASAGTWNYGVRKNGCSYDYYGEVANHFGFFVGLDSNKKWEGKIETTGIDFYTFGYFISGPNTPTLSKLFDNEKTNDTTPAFEFKATDSQSDDLEYQIEIDDDYNFGSINVSKTSESDTGFVNTENGGDGHPFTQNQTIRFTVQAGDALTNNTTYWWRVKAKDPSGTNAWSDYSAKRSFTVDTSVTVPTWFQTTDEQFDIDTLSFTHTYSSDKVRLLTGVQTFWSDNFSSDKGWTLGTGWSRGQATVSSGCDKGTDPASDHTDTADDMIIGYQIGGCYEDNIPATRWATSPTIDCSDFTGVHLKFYRVMGVEGSWDSSYIQAWDGSNWQTVWQNGASTLEESSWSSQLDYDVSTYADGNANFKIRFGMGTSDHTGNGCGWNVDDLEITGNGVASSGTAISSTIDYDDGADASAWDDVSWNDDETNGDIKYQVQYWDGDSWELIPDGALSGNSTGFDTSPIDISALNTTTYNQIRIKANFTDSSGTPYLEDWTVKWDSNTAPSVPTLSSPADGATGQSLTPDLVFNYSDTESDNCTMFDLKVDDNSDFSSCEINETDYSSGGPWASGGTITYSVSSGLSSGTKYYWKVRVKDDTDWSDWSDGSWDFTTLNTAPSVPTLSSPADGAIGQSITPDLVFNYSDTDSDTCTKFDLKVDNDSGFTSPEINETDYSSGGPWASGGTITYSVSSGLSVDTKYYWKVRVYDGALWSNWSDGSWDFTTGTGKRIISKGDSPYKIEIDDSLNVIGYIENQTVTTQITKAWHHIVLTYDKDAGGTDEIKLYVDGVLKDTGDYSTAMTTNSDVLKIGEKIPGKIDDVRIYDYARTPDEIRLDYNAGFATMFGSSGKTCSEDPASCMDNGLVASYDFDEGDGQTLYNAADTGSVNNGTLGSTSGSDVNDPKYLSVINNQSSMGPSGSALDFDGSNDYVDCGNDPSLNPGSEITVAAWVNLNSLSGTNSIVAKDNPSPTNYWCDIRSSGTMIYVGGYTSAGAACYNPASVSLETDIWYHIVWTYNREKMITYLDGVSVSDVYKTCALNINAAHCWIGSRSGGGSIFHGAIDDVRIYNRALSAEEVRYHYNRGGPVAHWRFDEGSGSTLHDESSNNNDGALHLGSLGNTATSSAWVMGKHGTAIDFDGTDDYVEVADDDSLDITDAITVSGWFNSSVIAGQTKKKPITITGSGSQETNYQVKVDVTYDSDMQADFDDIRFVDSDGTTEIDHWREDYTASTSAVFWVEVPVIPAGGTTIYMYYGNPTASSASNGDNTFLFFDDFPGTSLDTNKWTICSDPAGGSVVVSDGKVKITPPMEWGDKGIYSSITFSGDFIVDAKIKWDEGASNDSERKGIYLSSTVSSSSCRDGNNFVSGDYSPYYNDYRHYTYSGGTGGSVTHSLTDDNPSSYRYFRVKYQSAETWFKRSTDNWESTTFTLTRNTNIPSAPHYLILHCGAHPTKTNNVLFDRVFVREYAATEPAATVGAETTTGISKAGAYAIGANTTTAFVSINDQTISGTISSGWNYITLTYDKDAGGTEEMKLYANGIKISTNDYSTAITSNASNLIMDITGTLDDARVFAYARSTDEIRLDYNAGFAARFGPSAKTCSEDPASCMDNGLVASYDFDEGDGQTAYNAADTGSANNGTLGSSASADSADPKYLSVINNQLSMTGPSGSALSFDGSNDYVNCGNDSSLVMGTDDFTVEAWFKTSHSYSEKGSIIGNDDDAAPHQYYMLYVNPSDNLLKLDIRDTAEKIVNTSSAVNDGNWHHAVVIRDGDNIYLYFDSALVDSDTGVNNYNLTDTPTHIGRIPDPIHDRYFNGTIDDVRIYNRALSAEEVRYHYNRGGPVSHWRFDEGEGSIAYDETSNNNDGTLHLGSSGNTATSTAWVTGKHGSAIDFDGTDDYVDCGNDSSLNITDAITVEAWVKAPDSATFRAIYSRCGVPSAGQHYHTQLFRFTNTGTLQFYWENPDATGYNVTTTLSYDDNTWKHIVVTVDNLDVEIFVNGASVASDTEAAGMPSYTTDIEIFIGALATYTDTQIFNGSIDEVRIYNYARTQAQIQMDYNAGFGAHLK